jgi:hypothetical protein
LGVVVIASEGVWGKLYVKVDLSVAVVDIYLSICAVAVA